MFDVCRLARLAAAWALAAVAHGDINGYALVRHKVETTSTKRCRQYLRTWNDGT
jgi:hypothetical protein